MSRFLFVCPQFSGHVNPAVSVAMELSARGHETAWVVPGRSRPLLPPDAVVFPLDDELVERLRAAYAERAGDGHGLAKDFRCFWEDLVLPLARGTLEAVERAVAAYRPDELVVDQYALAGALAARRLGLVWATLVPTSFLQADATIAGLPRVKAWLDAQLGALQAEAGLDPVPAPERSPHLVVAFSIPSLAGKPRAVPTNHRFVGPAIEHRLALDGAASFPWSELRRRPRVLVTVGSWSAYRQERFFATAVEALADMPLQAVVIGPPEAVPEAGNVLTVRPWVNNLALFPHVDAVVCHGGQGTVFEALAHALPVVMAPVSFDHPFVAQEVVAAGAGVRVRAVRTGVAELRDAVGAVLAEPRYREAATRIQAAFRRAGGAPAAADALEGLIG